LISICSTVVCRSSCFSMRIFPFYGSYYLTGGVEDAALHKKPT
jgi:hypothetical protein